MPDYTTERYPRWTPAWAHLEPARLDQDLSASVSLYYPPSSSRALMLTFRAELRSALHDNVGVALHFSRRPDDEILGIPASVHWGRIYDGTQVGVPNEVLGDAIFPRRAVKEHVSTRRPDLASPTVEAWVNVMAEVLDDCVDVGLEACNPVLIPTDLERREDLELRLQTLYERVYRTELPA